MNMVKWLDLSKLPRVSCLSQTAGDTSERLTLTQQVNSDFIQTASAVHESLLWFRTIRLQLKLLKGWLLEVPIRRTQFNSL